jgi:hypothetical protein
MEAAYALRGRLMWCREGVVVVVVGRSMSAE